MQAEDNAEDRILRIAHRYAIEDESYRGDADRDGWNAKSHRFNPKPAKKFSAKLFGSSWANGPESQFDTIAAAREWAESYGTTADKCVIRDRNGKQVAAHVRSTENNGMDWFKASI